MKGSEQTIPFGKTASCPSANTLLFFRNGDLNQQISMLVNYHLKGCDFCRCEILLLAHHQRRSGLSERTPEIPINLRILAESILSHR